MTYYRPLQHGFFAQDAIGESAPFSPPLEPFGITRAGDLTSLDTIGIPVWFAVRPNARSLSVSHGAGLTPMQARVSAVMAAVEGAVAEQTRPLVAEFGTPAEMASRGRKLVPLRRLARCNFAAFDGRKQRAWVRGVNHGTGEDVFCPYELIGLDMRVEFPWDYDTFRVDSMGLASGPDFQFAGLNALLEVIEHDAVSAAMLGRRDDLARPLQYHPGVHQGLDLAVQAIYAAGLEVRFFDITSCIGVPVISAVITRPLLRLQAGGEYLSGGYACRLDAGEAALAALLEAVQMRATRNASASEAVTRPSYGVGGGIIAPPAADATPLAVFSKRYPAGDSSSAGRLERVVAAFKADGYHDIFFFDLPSPVSSVRVVRALVPGLRSLTRSDLSRADGHRLDGLAVPATSTAIYEPTS
ncbi:YcaO-like family protein [Labrys monachus]|uniref:Ribosomal protein S12 methylthiotransferase accessory factor n=1 Tax=Labrys monachus TaxID=217067 RepID=A0ABU0FQE2_9HYPH|nr:YcaO-like family protein [Labrys monachus]MDQ0396329.1 ribosomal protein S12 methylthiotransferase accessory factor [Labrys monachus]